MIIGARLAGGCTSGHFMSGMSQLAISSMTFWNGCYGLSPRDWQTIL